MPKDHNAYYFAHIPKTGGTSFIALLDRYFSEVEICPHQLWWDVGNIKEIKNKNYQLFRGHLGGIAQILSNHKLRYLTIFRDPVSLAASTYNYCKREQNTKVNEFINRHNLSFDAFVDHPKTRHLVRNRMLRALTFGLDNTLNFEEMTITLDTYRQFKRKINKNSPFNSAEERLNRLKKFILDCHWFGILDDYDCSIDLLCYVMGWPPVSENQKLNTHTKPHQIEPSLKKKIIALNPHDNELYNFAKVEFEKRYQLMLSDLGLSKDAKSKQLKMSIDSRYQSIRAREVINPIQKQKYLYTLEEPIIGDQWHRREWNPGTNKFFCWSGPGNHSFIDLWIQQKDYLIKIKVDNVISHSLIESLELHVNNRQPQWDFTLQGRAYELIIQCDKSMITSSGLLRIQFKSNELKVHKNIFSGTDTRLVGFAIEAIILELV